jgi:hypothetical protein
MNCELDYLTMVFTDTDFRVGHISQPVLCSVTGLKFFLDPGLAAQVQYKPDDKPWVSQIKESTWLGPSMVWLSNS